MHRSAALSALSCYIPTYSQNAGQESLPVPSWPICSFASQHRMPQLGSPLARDSSQGLPCSKRLSTVAGCPVPHPRTPCAHRSSDTAAQPVCLSTGCVHRCPFPSPYGGCRVSWHVLQRRPSSCTQCGLSDGFYTSEHPPCWLHPLLVLPCPSLLMAALTHHTGIYFYQRGPPDPHISNLAI